MIPTGGKLGLVDDSISDRLPNSQVYRTPGEETELDQKQQSDTKHLDQPAKLHLSYDVEVLKSEGIPDPVLTE